MTVPPPRTTRTDDERQLVLAAMSRIRDNTAQHGNGAHTVVALASESGIPRQRLYEHHADLLNEFKAAAATGPVATNALALLRQLAQAREHNHQLAAENTELRAKIRTLSAAIAELTHQGAEATHVVVPMPRRHPGLSR
ncbi:hypothetical protein LTT02_13145 [Mycolicibacterium smegmatis]|uniref:hypothetical protein n=1 Tax=Mycolicibacterium smegmatis TaxID=1772 RepID=UPI0005D758D4|nr:hypothetical protein [Mycolicibacterium smegmatis]MDF1902027.1 hypothetical protein [Mycolicibacterium smegmatis]MDF1908242.1 hypothetical protein [Mycolicibacterium smegmatis]MDF1920883.1 hypothetical protein [Mycolicibacterium smegmatis]MDF1926899.1 hypothetical protein [Mycolicibacterium smegmatis]UAK53453.1 hypothetical protein K8P01_22985 [Mycolicibacterium smegmatis]